MKFTVFMSDSEALDDAIQEAVGTEVGALRCRGRRLSGARVEKLREVGIATAEKLCEKWFENGESIALEIDTDAGTCVVVPSSAERARKVG